jgi:hypothetical protein
MRVKGDPEELQDGWKNWKTVEDGGRTGRGGPNDDAAFLAQLLVQFAYT